MTEEEGSTAKELTKVEKENSNPNFGPWMMAKKKGRIENLTRGEKSRIDDRENKGRENVGSRFGVLSELSPEYSGKDVARSPTLRQNINSQSPAIPIPKFSASKGPSTSQNSSHINQNKDYNKNTNPSPPSQLTQPKTITKKPIATSLNPLFVPSSNPNSRKLVPVPSTLDPSKHTVLALKDVPDPTEPLTIRDLSDEIVTEHVLDNPEHALSKSKEPPDLEDLMENDSEEDNDEYMENSDDSSPDNERGDDLEATDDLMEEEVESPN